jgi:TPP-dependent pyruvate/acetoin dehydrogenase alpha subunit
MSNMEIYKLIFYRMLITRFLEEGLMKEAKNGNTYGPIHLCLGQEAAGVAACAALNADDVISTTHRGHAHYLGKGLNLTRLCCEIFGKREGYGKGRAGHMIIFDRESGVLGGSGIVGGGLPLAVGQALAFKLQGQNRIAVAFFGDGASNTGSFHEAMNMAAKWSLPVMFFCESNQYGLTVHVEDHLSIKKISQRAVAYGIEGVTIFGNDFEEVYNATKAAVEKIRAGNGPMLIEAQTYRMSGFSTGDAGGYQREEEIEYWKARDPITIAEKIIVERGVYTVREATAQKEKARKEVLEAIEYAKAAAYPEPIVIPDDVYEGAAA